MKQITTLMLLILLTGLLSTVKAGENNGNHYGQLKHPKEGNRVPIDGGIILLLAAGAGYGVKRINAKHKRKISV